MNVDVGVDLLIVGAGPVGLYGAYYAGVRGLRTALVDSLSQIGGQVTAMYPEKQIYDVGGFPSIVGRDLIANLEQQAGVYDPIYLLDQEAQKLDRRPDLAGPEQAGTEQLVVTTSTGTAISCRAVVITGGIGTFTPRPLPAGEEFLGRGLAYFVPSLDGYADRDVVIVGGGDSAVDWALMLAPIAASVTLVHRRAAFRAHPGSLAALGRTATTLVTDAQVTETFGGEALEKVGITVKGDDTPRVLPCQRLVAALGFTANLGPVREWGITIHQNRQIVVDSAMRTDVPGIFAAGDVTEYDGKVKLISVGFGEVATAVNNAAVYIDPAAHVFPGHSSDVPQP